MTRQHSPEQQSPEQQSPEQQAPEPVGASAETPAATNAAGKFNRSRFARLLFHSLLTKIVMIALRLIRNAIIARVLGPTDRGLLALITSIPEVIMTIGNLGYSNSAAWKLAQPGAQPRQVMGAILAFVLIAGTLCAGASLWVIENPWLLRDNTADLGDWQWIIALAIPLFLVKTIHHNLLLVRDQVNQANLVNLNESLLPLVFFLLMWGVAGMNGLDASIYSWFVALLLLAIWTTIPLKDMFPPQWDQDTHKALLGYGVRGHFDTLFQKLMLRIDYFFVSGMVGATALGYYAMATAAAELLLVLPTAVTFPLYSFLMRNHRDDKRAVTPKVLRIMLVVMILGALALWITGELLIRLLFGDAFLPAYPALVWLLPGMIALGYCSLIRIDLLGENHPGSVSVVSGACVALNMGLNLVLTPAYGIEGTAAAATISYLIAAAALAWLHWRITGIPAHESMLVRPSDFAEITRYLRKKRAD
ncbi:Hapothetical protein [gamma proteobacterium HdN1]|nr:Hapothetical protein [gamma proteobacterium HdN1]